jgi:hypothetical protein
MTTNKKGRYVDHVQYQYSTAQTKIK